MIEPDRAGVAHRGPKHLAIGLEGLHSEPGGVEAGEAPVLAGGVERIRRRADRKMARDRRLLVPGIEAAGLHPDGDIEIEPHFHAELACAVPAGLQLAVGDPLHELDELDFRGIGTLAQASAVGVVRPPPLLRPFPPWPCELMPQHLEAGETRQQWTTFAAKPFEIAP